MSKKLRGKKADNSSTTNSLSVDFTEKLSVTSASSIATGDSERDLRKVQYFQLDAVTLFFQESTSACGQPVTIWLDTPSIQMSFVLSGARRYEPLAGYGPACTLLAGEHSLGYYTAMNGEIWYGESEGSLIMDVSFSEEYLRKAFQNDLSPLGNLGRAVEKAQSALIGNRSFPLTSTQRSILLAMYDCTLDGQLKKMFLEGKLLELLALQVAQFQNSSDAPRQSVLTREDVDKLEAVKASLLRSIDRPPSIKELAMLAGLNRTKLMSGFKELYGKTIYNYVADLRMDRAKELMLSDKYIKVAEIARLVGFKSPNNFSIAFKKRFGYSPTEFR